ncbi:MAG: GTPase ObgE [Rickettsiales bacterium]|jgi:GTP-binding protein|nr:GTPase ObgE [Rickettsiales bacterium]
MQFIDEADIHLKAGTGGNGKVGFLRLKYRPRGGPDGGDGGKGGDIIFRANGSLNTLLRFRHSRVFEAENGKGGGSSRKTGRGGRDLILEVPPGTQVLFGDGSLFFDLDRDGAEFLAARGGSGGFGNARFRSSTNQAPRTAKPGEEGEEFDLLLRLKLLSDVGLVGLPNVGKSTFLSSVSNARAKAADYPFTTTEPQLAVVSVGDFEFVMADLPGLVEQASSGRGLGNRFLKHIERCSILLHLVDSASRDPLGDYRTVRREIESEKYNISTRTEFVALTKIDLIDGERLAEVRENLEKEIGKGVYPLSCVSGVGLEDVILGLARYLEERSKNSGTGQPQLVI